MNKNTLIGLGVVVAVLAALVIVNNQRQQPGTLVDQVRLEPLVPAGLRTDDVARVELYKGGLPTERVVLARSAQDPAEWRVASHFDAPVDAQRIAEFLANTVGLRGEYRTTAQSDAALEPFDLTDETAFHVIGYGAADDTPLFHILVGKSPSFRTVFVRQFDNRVVYVEEIDLKRDAGIQQPFDDVLDASIVPPPPDHWVRKDILALAMDDIERLALTTPSRSVTLERRELAPPAADDDADEDAPPPLPEFEWIAAEGGPGGPLKSVGMESLLRRFANLRGETIADPSLAAGYGLEAPEYRIELTVAGEESPVILEAGRPDPTGPGYLRLSGSPHIYQVQSFAFDGLFPRATQLFDLPEVDMPLSRVREVRTHGPEGGAHLVKGEDDEWAVAAPAAPLPVQQTTVDELGRAAAVWKPVDYVNADVDTGLDTPRYTLTVTRDDGESVEVRIGNPSPEGGHYAIFDGAPMPLRMSQTDRDRLFPAPSDLYQLALLDLDREAVTRVEIERPAGAFALARDDDGAWTLTDSQETVPADADAIDAMLRAAGGLQAREILFELREAPSEPEAVVRIGLEGEGETAVSFGPDDAGYRWATVEGMAGVYRVPSAEADRMILDAGDLRAPAAETGGAES